MNTDKIKKYIQTYPWLITFLVMAIIGIFLNKVAIADLFDNLSSLLIFAMFISLALIIPIKAGLGFNFGIIIGTVAGQLGFVLAINSGLKGMLCLLVALVLALVFTILFGFINGVILSKSGHYAMITSYFLGQATSAFYLFIVFGLLGSLIPLSSDLMFPNNQDIRSTIDLSSLYPKDYHLIFFILLIGLLIIMYLTRKFDLHKKMLVGKSDMHIKIIAFMISTGLAALAQIFYLLNYKYIVVSYPNTGIWMLAIVSLIIGGGTYKKAKVKHALIGSLLYIIYVGVTLPALNETLSSQIVSPISNILVSLIILSVFVKKENNELKKETS